MTFSTPMDKRKLTSIMGARRRTETSRKGILSRTIRTETILDKSKARGVDGRVKSNPKRRWIFETELNRKLSAVRSL
jgi:hypothetical protein